MTGTDRGLGGRPASGARRRLGAGACACLALTWSAGTTLPAHASGPTPELSITVDNGASSVAPGDQLTYTITVTNLGGDRVRNLRLSQTVPQGASVVSTGSGGSVRGGTVRWTVDVPQTAKTTVRSTLRLSDPAPAGLNRLATVVCAAASSSGPPLVCATDSDLLPEGAAAEQRQAAPAGTAPAPRAWWPYAAGGALLLGAGAGGVLLHRRRRAASTAVAQRAALSDLPF